MKIYPPLHPENDPERAARISEAIADFRPEDDMEERSRQLALSLLKAGHLIAAEAELTAISERRQAGRC
ncbi:hypothetical protein [Burkholderia sp. PAMC 26561]|uniref:hypothetical protein n=1 Tax=Burkholderia sp. PAMC 26561 TaxID=1795043 RepID=UPI00076B448D|nr:hypothetical protein [Burkholderia sp. PAMC 26561]AME26894.1 hypothetical protein AXG89_23200 [Burkholderia sp. PAMC 26561]AME27960.1 hypothetical protein AXG89_29480 [Burkholderia sp. PAMC 26561]